MLGRTVRADSFAGFAVCGSTSKSLIEVVDSVWIETEPVCGPRSWE